MFRVEILIITVLVLMSVIINADDRVKLDNISNFEKIKLTALAQARNLKDQINKLNQNYDNCILNKADSCYLIKDKMISSSEKLLEVLSLPYKKGATQLNESVKKIDHKISVLIGSKGKINLGKIFTGKKFSVNSKTKGLFFTKTKLKKAMKIIKEQLDVIDVQKSQLEILKAYNKIAFVNSMKDFLNQVKILEDYPSEEIENCWNNNCNDGEVPDNDNFLD